MKKTFGPVVVFLIVIAIGAAYWYQRATSQAGPIAIEMRVVAPESAALKKAE